MLCSFPATRYSVSRANGSLPFRAPTTVYSSRRVSPALASRVAFFMFLSIGFVPLFADEIQRVRVAQSFRGGELKGSMLRRAGALRMWLVPVLMSAVRRSGELALAVELRDIRHRLVASIPPPRMRIVDLVWLLLVVAAVV